MDRPVRERVVVALERLVASQTVGDVRALTGVPGEFRLRVGDWRVRYELETEAEQLLVLRVLPRGSAYRDEALVNRYWSARRSPMASATSPPTLAGGGGGDEFRRRGGSVVALLG